MATVVERYKAACANGASVEEWLDLSDAFDDECDRAVYFDEERADLRACAADCFKRAMAGGAAPVADEDITAMIGAIADGGAAEGKR